MRVIGLGVGDEVAGLVVLERTAYSGRKAPFALCRCVHCGGEKWYSAATISERLARQTTRCVRCKVARPEGAGRKRASHWPRGCVYTGRLDEDGSELWRVVSPVFARGSERWVALCEKWR